MDEFELDPAPPGGGHARDGGCYHGACAGSAHDYIARENQFDGPELDRAVHVESGHMPSWARGDAREYWDAADLYERANGRLYVGGDFALPRGFELQDQIDVAREFVESLTARENLPYTFAIHAGEDRDGREHNPHVHVMISERRNDGIARSPHDWFGRANRDHPDRGGALKSREFHGRGWVERARADLAKIINDKLRELGRDERVDHRSYERQGVHREPGEHFGPRAAQMIEGGRQHDRLEEVASTRDYPTMLADLDQRIERLEQRRDAIAREEDSVGRDQGDRLGNSYSNTSVRDDDSRGR
jgi:MobA/MobL family